MHRTVGGRLPVVRAPRSPTVASLAVRASVGSRLVDGRTLRWRRSRSPEATAAGVLTASAVVLALIRLPAHLGYLILFGLIAAESSGVPLPGESALITAGVLAHDGQLDVELVIVIAAAAAVVGDNVGYLIGRSGGRRLLERPGFMETHRRRIIEKGEPFFARHGPKAVFLGRWVAGLRIAAAWLAGINRMPWPVFLFWNALGGIAWAASVGLLAYYLGATAERVFKVVGVSGIALALLAAVGYLAWRRMRREGEDADGR
jgi:undecaprenyl-diphosphatase